MGGGGEGELIKKKRVREKNLINKKKIAFY